MKFIKFLVDLTSICLVIVLCFGLLEEYEIIDMLKELLIKEPTTLVTNEYNKSFDSDYVTLTNDFFAKSNQDLLNIYYTVLSSGMDEFTFYCDTSYESCEDDINKLNEDSMTLSTLNNFVSVYNSFKSIKTSCLANDKVIIYINKVYTEDDITYLKNKVDEIYNEIIDVQDTQENNIRKIHDYIINNTKYSDTNNSNNANNAVGVFNEKKANCNGYTDAASLLLDKLGVTNMKISNETHIWNLVNVNNRWLHMDVTWDDPVNNLDQDLLFDTYFLKNTNDFLSATEEENIEEHTFNKDIYYFVN